jgi:four helix bundle protein
MSLASSLIRVRMRMGLAAHTRQGFIVRFWKAQVMGDQVLRLGTSVGAHFREAQCAKSNADFISKIEGGMQELEETVYWLELLEETDSAPCVQDAFKGCQTQLGIHTLGDRRSNYLAGISVR